MATGLLHLHNLLRWLVLLFALITIFRTLGGLSGNKPFTAGHRKTTLFLMICCDIQLLLGLALYFMKDWFKVLTSGGGFMSNPAQRFFAVEHAVGMIIAIILVHVGYSATKKGIADGAKYKRVFWCTLIALIIILATIPWPFREAIARPLFPGMTAGA